MISVFDQETLRHNGSITLHALLLLIARVANILIAFHVRNMKQNTWKSH